MWNFPKPTGILLIFFFLTDTFGDYGTVGKVSHR